MTKFGVALNLDNAKVGLTITTPTYSSPLRGASYDFDDLRTYGQDSTILISNLKSAELKNYRTPFSIGVGFDFPINKTRVSFSMEYFKRIPVMRVFRAMFPALNIAFWSKSSGVALPVAIRCAKNNLRIKPKIADLSLPLCTTINMNACAAFIITTVLFVATSNGMEFSNYQLISWIFIATIAAIILVNRGIPLV